MKYRMTRMQRKQHRAEVCIAAGITLLLAAAVIVLLAVMEREEEQIRPVSKEIYHLDAHHLETEIIEAPDEGYLIAEAVAATIGTEREAECLGYNIEPVFRAVMGEGGGESDEYIRELFTVVFNIACKTNVTPEQAVVDYQFHSAKGYSDRVKRIGIDVLIYGNWAEEVKGATVFYSPDKYGINTYHELQKEVLEVELLDGTRARFFEEVE